jgi:hypothetical protein
VLVDNAIADGRSDEVAEVRTLGHTLSRWKDEISNQHHTGASNGPTKGSNFCAKQVKRAGRGLHELRALPGAGVAPCRRGDMAETDPTAEDHVIDSPLKPGEPDDHGRGRRTPSGRARGSGAFMRWPEQSPLAKRSEGRWRTIQIPQLPNTPTSGRGAPTASLSI